VADVPGQKNERGEYKKKGTEIRRNPIKAPKEQWRYKTSKKGERRLYVKANAPKGRQRLEKKKEEGNPGTTRETW